MREEYNVTTHEGLLHRFLDLLTRNLYALVISHGFHIPFAVRFDMLLQKPRHVICKSTMNGCPTYNMLVLVLAL